MSTTQTTVSEAGRRVLAAIVFTDVDDFSARVQENEEQTLALVRRDLERIRAVCAAHEGRVLKSTGDGLLLYFDSAVQAVACALAAQRELAEAAQGLPPAEVLQHRIGIHLGDVFLSDSDVMGDGVNIAARLQAEAAPGGICLSQTVYDVVKHRLALQAVYLGPRELKNIREAVPIYHILAAATGAVPVTASRVRRARWRAWVWGLAALAVLLMVVGAWAWGRAGREPVAAVGAPEPAAPVPSAAAPGALDATRRIHLQNGDFAGMLAWLERHGLRDSQTYAHFSTMAQLRQRAMTRLAETSAAQPLVVGGGRGDAAGSLAVWRTGDGQIAVRDAAGTRTLSPDEMPAALQRGIAVAMVREKAGSGPGALAALRDILDAFEAEYAAAGIPLPSDARPQLARPRLLPRTRPPLAADGGAVPGSDAAAPSP